MNNNPCVSIVLPIYNQERYLDTSIPSVLEQTYTNLQIVLVNDGSTDATTAMLRRYAADDPRIILIEKPNGGVIDAMLAGIEAADSEYICFMDPDDLLGKDFVQTFMENMTPDCDFVAAGYYTDNRRTLTPCPLLEDRVYMKEQLRECRNYFLSEPGILGISNRFFIARWNKLYRTQVVKEAAQQLQDCRHISLGDDVLLTYLVLCYSAKGITLAAPNSYYYNISNQNSLTKKVQAQPLMENALAAYTKMKSLTEEFGTSGQQAYALYGFLVETLRHRLMDGDYKQYCAFVRQLRKNELYQKGMHAIHMPEPQSKARRLYRKIVVEDSEFALFLGTAKRLMKKCVQKLHLNK